MVVELRFEEALRASDRVNELRKLAEQLLREGNTHDALLERFEHVRHELGKAEREEDEDAILDVMDFLAGWCSPHMSLRTGQCALWDEISTTLKHHAEAKTEDPIKSLNRLFREKFIKEEL